MIFRGKHMIIPEDQLIKKDDNPQVAAYYSNQNQSLF